MCASLKLDLHLNFKEHPTTFRQHLSTHERWNFSFLHAKFRFNVYVNAPLSFSFVPWHGQQIEIRDKCCEKKKKNIFLWRKKEIKLTVICINLLRERERRSTWRRTKKNVFEDAFEEGKSAEDSFQWTEDRF